MSAPHPASPWRLAIAPRNWPLSLGLGLLYLAVQLPRPVQRAISNGLGRLLHRLAGRRRRITEINIGLAFPDRDRRQQSELVHAHFRAMAHSLIELGKVWWSDLEEEANRFSFTGLEHFEAAREAGGVLLFSAHFASWEYCGCFLARRIGMAASYRPHENPLLDALLRYGRERHIPRLYARDDLRGMLRELKQGGVLWYASDQNFGHKGSEFAEFCGVPAATNTAARRIARSGRASVVPYFPLRHRDGRYELLFLPPLEPFPGDDAAEDARRMNAAIEVAVARAPEQYFWSHRRYKDRPGKEKRFY